MGRCGRDDGDGRGGELCGEGGSVAGSPAPGQEVVDLLGRVGGEASEDVAQVGFGIEAVELGGLDQGVHGGGALAAVVGAGEQPVLAAEGDGAHGAFGGVVVDLQASVVAVAGQL